MITFRPVNEEDIKLLIDWANERSVREMSIKQKSIDWPEHMIWIKKQLADDQIKMFLLEKDGIPVGQLRLEKKADDWMIGYSVDAKYRGNGYGKQLIRRALDTIEKGNITALVKPANKASFKIFSDLGFSNEGVTEQDGVLLNRFVYAKQ